MAGWDNVRLKRLKTLAGKGLSSTEIGKCLGMSKNAIIGKLNRMGWNLKATTGHTKTVATKADDKPAKKTKLPVSKKIAPVKPVVMPKATKVAKAGARKKSDADKKTKTTKSEKKTIAACNAVQEKRINRVGNASTHYSTFVGIGIIENKSMSLANRGSGF